MRAIIEDRRKDPLGAMMLDYLSGREDACVEVESTTLDMWTMRGETMFRSYAEMDKIERLALQLCEGKILDVGAGAGVHALYLQEEGKDVEALDISPGCVEVMAKRKIKRVIHGNLFSLTGRKYKTILMLMNGLGICGTVDGCNLFLQFIQTVLDEGGQVVADSTDLAALFNNAGVAQCATDRYFGETEFVMRYQNISSNPFSWLYIDLKTLQNLAGFNGLQCERVISADSGRYLVRIFL